MVTQRRRATLLNKDLDNRVLDNRDLHNRAMKRLENGSPGNGSSREH